MLIVVTGSNGQVGGEIKNLHQQFSSKYQFLFTTRKELDLAKPETITSFFIQHQPNYFINCAAYTAVDKAETETELAKTINALSVGLIAKHCATIGCKLIHVSTDYVFDGTKQMPYLTNDKPNPINVYGVSKWLGEQLALQNNPSTIIVRTSWVYNKTGKNFVNTMKRLMQEKENISVVNDQIGCPTYAPDLAKTLLVIIDALAANKNRLYKKIYHYSNTGNISWYEFAVQIKELITSNCIINPISSSQFILPAKRSHYSVLECSEIVRDFGVAIKNWKESLKECLL